MFGSTILEVAVCLVFMYLLISLICSTINEWIASAINMRGRILLKGIKNLLNDQEFKGLSQQLYCHGLVAAISKDAADPKKSNRLPSYMSSSTFALALMDILAAKNVASFLDENIQPNADDETKKKLELMKNLWTEADNAASEVNGPEDFKNLQRSTGKFQLALDIGREAAADLPDPISNIYHAVKKLSAGHTKESLLVILAKLKKDIIVPNITPTEQMHKLQTNIEAWFNDAMDRIGGWYKRWTQVILLIISFVLVCAANVDTLSLAKQFTNNTALRSSIITLAQKESAQSSIPNDILKDAKKITLPIGWPENPVPDKVYDWYYWLLKLLGLLITIAAVSMGAPFWFDTLSKFVNLRGAGTPPGETKKSAPQFELTKAG